VIASTSVLDRYYINAYQDDYLEEGVIADTFISIYNKLKNVKKTASKKLEEMSDRIFKNIPSLKKQQQKLEKDLKSKNIDVERIKELARKHADAAYKEIKRNPSKFSFQKHLNRFTEEVQEEMSFGEKFTLALLAVMAGIFLLRFAFHLFFFLTGNESLSLFLQYVFFAPVIEETAKMLSVKKGFGGVYFVLFNIFEVFNNASKYVGDPTKGIFDITAPVLLHGITTLIHYAAPKDDHYLHWVLAVIMHGLFNSMSDFK